MWSLALVTSLHYAVLNLMGETDLTQPFVFHEEINSEEELFNNGLARGDETLIDTIYLNRLLVAFWSKKYETTVDVAKLRGKTNVMCILDICHVFYEGIAALRVARRENTERDSLIEIGEKALSTFETWKSYSNWNFENKLLLLAAELYYTKGELHAAEKQYKASIESAQAHRFLHEEGLALEELGMLYKEMGNLEQAEIVTLKALSCYERWGATAIVKQLDSELKGWNITEKS
jgi:tetratricopeptide (TPR) repeat protein